jgi:hypothetical protein
MTRRRVLLTTSVAFVACWWLLVVIGDHSAFAAYRGGDYLTNLQPESGWGGGPLMSQWPISHYGLDTYIDGGPLHPAGWLPQVADFMATILWDLTAGLVWLAIVAFTLGSSLNLLGPGGLLSSVGHEVTATYAMVSSWTIVATSVAGGWALYRWARGEHERLATGLGMSLLLAAMMLAFVMNPARVVGPVSNATNQVTAAVMAPGADGTLGTAPQRVADQLFKALVLEPWVTLDFGGLRHCVNIHRVDKDGFPAATGPGRTLCRDHLRQDAQGFGGYAPRYLKWAVGSDERKDEYTALKTGKIEDLSNPQFVGWQVDKADSTSVDFQQQDEAIPRLLLTGGFAAALTGAVLLIGWLAAAMVVTQIVALLLLGFLPFVAVVSFIPDIGFGVVVGWCKRFAAAMTIKIMYAVLLKIVVVVTVGIGATSSVTPLGEFLTVGLLAIVYWAAFLKREWLLSLGQHAHHHQTVDRGSYLLRHPLQGMIAAGSAEGIDRRIEQERTKGDDGPEGTKGDAARPETAVLPGTSEPPPPRQEPPPDAPSAGSSPGPEPGPSPGGAGAHQLPLVMDASDDPASRNGHGPASSNGHAPAPAGQAPAPAAASENGHGGEAGHTPARTPASPGGLPPMRMERHEPATSPPPPPPPSASSAPDDQQPAGQQQPASSPPEPLAPLPNPYRDPEPK